MALGHLFIAATVADKSVAQLLAHGPIEHLFKANEVDLYAFVREFVKQYGTTPSPDTIEAHTGETLPDPKEPASYYVDLMKIRHTELQVKRAMKQASDLLLPENKDPEQALRVLTTMVMELAARKNAKQVVDFRDAYDVIIADIVSKVHAPDTVGLHMGWPYLDTMTGGLVQGDIASFIGRPGAGKTWMMLYAALHGWRKEAVLQPEAYSQSRMFVSMEMAVLPIQQRLAAITTSISASQIKHGALSTKKFKQLKDGLLEIKGFGAPFYVVDGNLTATVEDIWMLARQLKPGAIFIDGAYLVKHPTERDRYRRVAENADLMKQELAALCPTVTSWQFAKSASKKNSKKGEKVGLEDIGYTDAIAQVSSLAVGLFQDESVETINQRKGEVLKGRNGETGSFNFRWHFDKMDFTEIVEEDISDLQFL